MDLRDQVAEALYEPPVGASGMAKLLSSDAHARRVDAVMGVVEARVRELEDDLGEAVGTTGALAARVLELRIRETARDERIAKLEEENQRMRDDLAHAVRFQIGAVEVYEGRFGGWVVCVDRERLDKATDRDAALSRARQIAEEEA
jgi:hypothetical protein